MFSPLEQFDLIRFCSVSSSSDIYLFVYVGLLCWVLFEVVVVKFRVLVFVWFVFFVFLYDILSSFAIAVSGKLGAIYVYYYFGLALGLFCFNVYSLVPFGYTFAGQLLITLFLSFFYFFCINFICILRYGFYYIYLFLPSGAPSAIVPVVFLIEIVSYFSRVISIAVRIFANIMSGHILLHILTFFLFLSFVSFSFVSMLIGCIASMVLLVIIFMELGIACLQVYVFLTMSCLYLSDTVNIGSH